MTEQLHRNEDDGWIAWYGGLPRREVLVPGLEARLRNGRIVKPCIDVAVHNWAHDGVDPDYDYVAYRIVPATPEIERLNGGEG